MNTSFFLRRPLVSTSTFICWRCESKRQIAQTTLQRRARGRQQWAEFAEQIRNGARKPMLAILQERGLVQDVAGGSPEEVSNVLTSKRLGVYVGVDPTAASLHVGNMVPLMALFWMFFHGFHALTLLGGSTARIGDPSGRTTDRPEMTPTERKANIVAIHYQLKKMWLNVEALGKQRGFAVDEHFHRDLTNNNTWWNKLPMLEVLKLIGPAFRIGPMLGRDTVRTKLESGGGMSFSEFCYPIMQAWDWWQMYEQRGIQMQIGGSDQYGNIVAGVDAVRYASTNHPDPDIRRPEDDSSIVNNPVGLTVPLLTTASGQKFGKSSGNAIWLDEQMTSVFDLYGFFIGTDDRDVQRYLKIFTFLPLDKIQSICAEHAADPGKRVAQHTLAREFVSLVHGEKAATTAEAQHRASRSQSLSTLLEAANSPTAKPTKPNPLLTHQRADKRQQGTFINRNVNQYAVITDANTNRGAMNITLPKSLVYQQPVGRVLYAAGLVSSRSEGHRLVSNGGAYIGSQADGKQTMSDAITYIPAKLQDPMQTWKYVVRDAEGASRTSHREGDMHTPGEEGVLVLRAGKWKIRVVRIVSDALFESMAVDPPPPGWAEFKAEQIAAASKQEFADLQHKTDAAAADDDESSGGGLSRGGGFSRREAGAFGKKASPSSSPSRAGDLQRWQAFQDGNEPSQPQKYTNFKESQQKGFKYFNLRGGGAEQDRRSADRKSTRDLKTFGSAKTSDWTKRGKQSYGSTDQD